MYAIANINGIQTRVTPDAVLEIPRMAGEPGQKLAFDEILMVCDGDRIAVGQPFVHGARCTAELIEHFRGPKMRIYTFRRRQDSKKRRGYRDDRTRIRVTGIQA